MTNTAKRWTVHHFVNQAIDGDLPQAGIYEIDEAYDEIVDLLVKDHFDEACEIAETNKVLIEQAPAIRQAFDEMLHALGQIRQSLSRMPRPFVKEADTIAKNAIKNAKATMT